MCFHALPPEPTLAMCVGSCQPGPVEGPGAVRGYKVISRTLFPVNGRPDWTCPGCRSSSRQEACEACAFPIPRAMRDWSDGSLRRSTVVAMAGARASGKSLMIGSMMQKFELLCERHLQSVLTPLGDTGERFQRAYLDPLYVARRSIQFTPELSSEQGNPTREPFVWTFREKDGTERVLAIRDVAGEDLENLDSRNPLAFSFLSRADAVIALLDPWKVPEVRTFLGGIVTVPPMEVLGGNDQRVLASLIRLLRTVPDPPALGIALSKFDVLQELRSVRAAKWPEIMGRAGSPLVRDPSLTSAEFDQGDGDLLHHELFGVLKELQVQTVLGLVHGLRFRLFACSSLGSTPISDSELNPVGVAPYRVLDPLKWVLAGAPAASDGR